MNVATLVYRPQGDILDAVLAWVDPLTGQVLHQLPVPNSPNLGLFPELDCVLVSYSEYSADAPPTEWLDVYRLSDWSLRARLAMDCRAQFNVCPEWCTFIHNDMTNTIYLYKAATLGNHLAEDYVGGLDVATLQLAPWSCKLPECMIGWSAAGDAAHAQMLFIADGLEVGRLPSSDLEQRVGFWLGPEDGMGPMVSIGPRPRDHSQPGHARAILFARERPLSLAVCNDGTVHLIDPQSFRYLEQQRVRFADGFAMPIFAAQVEPKGRWLYVGTAADGPRQQGLIEHIVVHDLDHGRLDNEWTLEQPFTHMALSSDGQYLCGAGVADQLWVLDAHNGRVEAVVEVPGFPQYVIPAN